MNKEKLQEVQNGTEVQDLLNHNGWKLIEESFNSDKDIALEELVKVSPHDYQKIMELQNRINMYIELVSRVRQLILIGQQAREELDYEIQTGDLEND